MGRKRDSRKEKIKGEKKRERKQRSGIKTERQRIEEKVKNIRTKGR